ncbi:hypothetical protein GcC1_092014 [Golovinomyces cichoracearum]|uniref:DUF6570 domain-containing protein n=1 Tax=Golovinomyces cichoracearum TaxID=62708 RepID=A0A420IEE6_9PEZI|nr:hypothetical protein GcC1_092014 [Golovinomyces cichoracearum]
MEVWASICHHCRRRDKGNARPFLMDIENDTDTRELPAHLSALIQLEELYIARCHVPMMVHRVRGHQNHQTHHCVTSLQNNSKIIENLPSLPTEVDIFILQPLADTTLPDQAREGLQNQYRADFRARRGAVVALMRPLCHRISVFSNPLSIG